MANNILTRTFLYYIVYKTTCSVNNKIYIGCHATDDLDDGYIGSGKCLKRAISKYGKSNFVREVLFIYDSHVDMFAKEIELVTQEFIDSEESYNLVVGGSGGFKILNIEEWKDKLKVASANRERKTPMLGKHHSEETKLKMSNANAGRPTWNKGLPGTWIGKTHSDESKLKISKSKKGQCAGNKNPMFGKSAVAGRKWYNDGLTTYYLFPTDPKVSTLVIGRLKKVN